MNFNADLWNQRRKAVTRRYFFKECGIGLGRDGPRVVARQ